MSKDNLLSNLVEKEKKLQKTEEKIKKRIGEQNEQVKQSSKSFKDKNKNLRNERGWKHPWITIKDVNLENDLSIRDAVPGPFNSPRLVRVIPLIKNSNKQEAQKENEIRCGIPDTWTKYTATTDYDSGLNRKLIKRDLDIGYKNARLTDIVLNKFGIPLIQGIPDPWKSNLSEEDPYLEDERAEICLCEPMYQKDEKIDPACCDKFDEKIRSNTNKEEKLKCCQPREKSSKISKIKKSLRQKEKKFFKCNMNYLSESQNIIAESLDVKNNVITCKVNGKIMFDTQGREKFNGIGYLEFKCVQNENDFRNKQKEETQCNKFSKTSKIRHMITNFEPKKQFSKLKKAFNGKKCDQVQMNCGEEKKFVCYNCSCPNLKILSKKAVDNNLLQERNVNKKSNSHNWSKSKMKSSIMKCDKSECETTEKRMKQHLGKNIQKDKSIESFKCVKVPVDKKEKKNLDDKVQCVCEIQYTTEDNTDSGNHADISQLSKYGDMSLTESTMNSSFTYKTDSKEKLNKTSSTELRDKKKMTHKKYNLCSPCGRKPIIKQQRNITHKDLPADCLINELSNGKHEVQNFEINSRHSGLIVENLSNISNEKLFLAKKTKKTQKYFQNEYRKREGGGGGGMLDFWSSNSEVDKYEVRKNAWCKQKGSVDDSLNIKLKDKEEIDTKLDNEISEKVFSSLLEESLDLISEPIGRRKTSENFKISTEKRSKNKCYTKYCYDRSEK